MATDLRTAIACTADDPRDVSICDDTARRELATSVRDCPRPAGAVGVAAPAAGSCAQRGGDQAGERFSMKACTPSSAASSIMLQAMDWPAMA